MIIPLVLFSLAVLGLCLYLYMWVKTKTWPFEISDEELFAKAFGRTKGITKKGEGQ